MVKVFYCRFLGVECMWGCSARTEEELLEKVTEHAAKEHGVKEMSEAMLNKIKASIKEQQA